MRSLGLLLLAAACAAGEQIPIRVADPLDASVPDARVEARSRSGDTQAKRTGPDGQAAFDLAPPLEVRVVAEGFEPASETIRAAGGGTRVIRLRPAILRTSVDVVVRDEPDPLPSAETRLEIERTGARTVLDAVDRVVPGAFVTRRGVMGYGIATNGTGGISIRGVGGSPNTGVLVVVDGRPDYMGLMGHPLPDFYTLSDAATVTVIEGPASVLYGSNAMGGVVEIRPWLPREGYSTRLTASGGSFRTGQYNLSHGAAFERGWYSVNAGAAHTAGERHSSAFRSQDGTLTAGYLLSPVWRASLEGRYGHFHVEDPGPVTAPLANSYARVGRGGFTASLDNTTARLWGRTRVYSSFGKHLITDGFRSTDRTTGVRADQNAALAPGLTVQFGADLVNYGGQARNVTSRLNYGEHTLTSAAGFGRAQWLPARRLRLHSGLRYESNSRFGATTAPEFGVAYTLREGYSLALEVAKGYRNPTIRELYLFPAPNPNLLPEYLWNYQASFQARPVPSLSTTVTAYYADLSNLIVTTGRFPNLRLLNAGTVLNRGIETTGRWRAARRVTVQSGYAWLRSANLPPYLPRHKFNFGCDVDAGKASLHFGAMAVGERYGNAQRTVTLGSYTLGTLKVTVPLGRAWRLHALVDNLFSQDYQVLPGYPMPGANAMGGFTLSF